MIGANGSCRVIPQEVYADVDNHAAEDADLQMWRTLKL